MVRYSDISHVTTSLYSLAWQGKRTPTLTCCGARYSDISLPVLVPLTREGRKKHHVSLRHGRGTRHINLRVTSITKQASEKPTLTSCVVRYSNPSLTAVLFTEPKRGKRYMQSHLLCGEVQRCVTASALPDKVAERHVHLPPFSKPRRGPAPLFHPYLLIPLAPQAQYCSIPGRHMHSTCSIPCQVIAQYSHRSTYRNPIKGLLCLQAN